MDFLTQFFQVIANMSAASFAQHIVNGISLGSLYALIAIGYTMVYGILLMINFAHADIVMMACYFAFFGITVFHIPWYLTFILVIIATALLGVVIERTAYRPLRDAPKNSVLISAIGASFLLENLANYLFSGRPLRFPDIPLLSQTIAIGSVQIQAICLVIPVINNVQQHEQADKGNHRNNEADGLNLHAAIMYASFPMQAYTNVIESTQFKNCSKVCDILVGFMFCCPEKYPLITADIDTNTIAGAKTLIT